jgi:nucleotidyltransferase/DNA polymerase involved in DNA repair
MCQVSVDEAYVEFNPSAALVAAHGGPAGFARAVGEQLRALIRRVTRCTASTGIGPNKILARLATAKVPIYIIPI